MPIGYPRRPRTREAMYSVLERLSHVHEAPLLNARKSLWWLRKTFFTRPRSECPAFRIPAGKAELVRLLGRHHFSPGWELSYNYHGEVLNMRRAEYHDHASGRVWWQVHVRGYEGPDGTLELTSHFETDPSEHPDAHVRLVGLDVGRGMCELRRILEANDVAYEVVDPPAEAKPVTDARRW